MEQEIITILKGINPYIEINVNSRLLEEEILDSTGILLLITELEQKYGVEIPFENLQIEDFETIFSIIKLIKRLL